MAASAQWYLENRPRTRRRDCSGLVVSILRRAGVRDANGNTGTLWKDARRDGRVVSGSARPEPGYLVFFDKTYDANRNGRVDDALSHVAVVVRVDAHGTVTMVHRGSGRIKELLMNLREPAVHRTGDRVLNDYLRAPGYGSPSGPRLAGQLFRGFALPPPPRHSAAKAHLRPQGDRAVSGSGRAAMGPDCMNMPLAVAQ